IDAIEQVVLDAVVDQCVNLHEPVERGARRFQQQLQVPEDDMRLAGQRPVSAFAGLRVDRQHAGAEDEPAGADCRRLVMSVVLPQVEPCQRGGDEFAHTGARLNSADQSETCATPGSRKRSMLPRAGTSPRLTKASSKAFSLAREIFPVRSKKLFLRKKS